MNRFILVISCVMTRAISLEIMESSSSRDTIMGLQSHSAVFSTPLNININNSLGFVVAAKELDNRGRWLLGISQNEKLGLKWHFNLPYSPTWSGHVKIMVKLTKNL